MIVFISLHLCTLCLFLQPILRSTNGPTNTNLKVIFNLPNWNDFFIFYYAVLSNVPGIMCSQALLAGV